MPLRTIALGSDSKLVIQWLSDKSRNLLETEPELLLWELEDLANPNSEKLFELAVVYDHLGRESLAKSFWKKALEKNLSHAPSLYALALSALEAQNAPEAMRYLKRVLRTDSQAAENVKLFQNGLRTRLPAPEAGHWALWTLEQLHHLKKDSDSCRFEYAKLLFERSKFQEASELFYSLVRQKQFAYESTQYLSYIYEKMYRGDELLNRCLDLASLVEDKSDIFFNLAMLCQNERRDTALALHFYYLASRFEPADPGLKFSLEQACVELIGEIGRSADPKRKLSLFFCHAYHGSLALAERYAQSLRSEHGMRFPQSFETLDPQRLWHEWLLAESSPLRDLLDRYFGDQNREASKKPVRIFD